MRICCRCFFCRVNFHKNTLAYSSSNSNREFPEFLGLRHFFGDNGSMNSESEGRGLLWPHSWMTLHGFSCWENHGQQEDAGCSWELQPWSTCILPGVFLYSLLYIFWLLSSGFVVQEIRPRRKGFLWCRFKIHTVLHFLCSDDDPKIQCEKDCTER